jgi:S-adenosylmethionine decarboxylase
MKHLIVHLTDVHNVNILKDVLLLEPEMDEIMSRLDFHVVGKASHQFKPHGATLIYLLAESHCSVHTFWEEREAYIDIFCCTGFDETFAMKLIIETFQAQCRSHNLIHRDR